MLSSLKALAAAADNLRQHGHAAVTETETAITISAIQASDAAKLLPVVQALGWPFEIVDSAGEHADGGTLVADFEPFIATIQKPISSGLLQIVTLSGLEGFLQQERSEDVWQLASLSVPFATFAVSFQPWGAADVFSRAANTKSPRELVREYGSQHRAPKDIRFWLLRAPVSEELWGDETFQSYAKLAVPILMQTLASEIGADGSLVFFGPPRTRLDPPANDSIGDLGFIGINDLRAAAVWVYENALEAERRHTLFAAEFARSSPYRAAAGAAFALVLDGVLEGARLAYQLSLSDLSREAIKAQSDLRKAVADDAAKLAENSRQVATAVGAAIATCIALIAAKIGTATPGWVLSGVAITASAYVASVVLSGWLYMRLQRRLRTQWRTRLYRFIPEPDYEAMVAVPAQSAERIFTVSVIAGIVASTAAFIIAFVVM